MQEKGAKQRVSVATGSPHFFKGGPKRDSEGVSFLCCYHFVPARRVSLLSPVRFPYCPASGVPLRVPLLSRLVWFPYCPLSGFLIVPHRDFGPKSPFPTSATISLSLLISSGVPHTKIRLGMKTTGHTHPNEKNRAHPPK